jgi:hypothetical protein
MSPASVAAVHMSGRIAFADQHEWTIVARASDGGVGALLERSSLRTVGLHGDVSGDLRSAIVNVSQIPLTYFLKPVCRLLNHVSLG